MQRFNSLNDAVCGEAIAARASVKMPQHQFTAINKGSTGSLAHVAQPTHSLKNRIFQFRITPNFKPPNNCSSFGFAATEARAEGGGGGMELGVGAAAREALV